MMALRSGLRGRDAAWICIGGAGGALLRSFAHQVWSSPIGTLAVAVIMTTVTLAVTGLLVADPPREQIRSFVSGLAAGTASLSGYAVLTVNQAPWNALFFALSVPGAAIAGFAVGLAGGHAIHHWRTSNSGPQ